MCDPYKLDIIVKVNKQAFQRYKVQCQLFVCTEKDYLNNVPIPPPLLSVMTALIKVTFGAADLMRVVMFRLYSFTVTVQGLTDSCWFVTYFKLEKCLVFFLTRTGIADYASARLKASAWQHLETCLWVSWGSFLSQIYGRPFTQTRRVVANPLRAPLRGQIF